MPSQIVVMAGGLNDFVLGDPPVLEDWRSSYLDFLQLVCMSCLHIVTAQCLLHAHSATCSLMHTVRCACSM